MTRAPRTLLAALLVAGTVLVTQVASPQRAFACSCAGAAPIGAYADAPELVVVAGEISAVHISEATGRQVGTITLTHVFKGPVPALKMSIIGGDGADCGAMLNGLSRAVLVASVDGGAIRPLACTPHADLGTPEGQQLLTEAIAAYGSGIAADGDGLPVPGSDLALAVILVLLACLTGGMFFVIARRRSAS